jgi:hypothetical protein
VRRDEIEEALRRLGERLHARGVQAEVMLLVGGAAMCLAFAARAMTRDVDAVFEPKSLVAEEARVVAADMGLQPDWLNDGAKGFLSATPPASRQVVFSMPGLLVWAPPADYIFAMKCLAARVEDRPDILFLAKVLDIHSFEEAASLVLKHFPAGQVLPRTRFTLEELFGPAAG